MQRLSDNVLQAVLDAHRIFASVDTKTSKIDRYTVKFLEELRMYRSSGLTPEEVQNIDFSGKNHD